MCRPRFLHGTQFVKIIESGWYELLKPEWIRKIGEISEVQNPFHTYQTTTRSSKNYFAPSHCLRFARCLEERSASWVLRKRTPQQFRGRAGEGVGIRSLMPVVISPPYNTMRRRPWAIDSPYGVHLVPKSYSMLQPILCSLALEDSQVIN